MAENIDVNETVVRILQDFDGAVLDEAARDGEPATLAENAYSVAEDVSRLKDVDPVVRTAIVAVYGHDGNSLLHDGTAYRDLAVRAASGLVAIRDMLPASDYEAVPLLAEGRLNTVLAASANAGGLIPNTSSVTAASVSLKLLNPWQAEPIDPGIVPATKKLPDDEVRGQPFLLENGGTDEIDRLEAIARNNGPLVIGHERIIEHLKTLDQPGRLLRMAALRSAGGSTDLKFRNAEYGVDETTRRRTIRDAATYLLNAALDDSHVPRDRYDTPPDVRYEREAIAGLTQMLRIKKEELGSMAFGSLDILIQAVSLSDSQKVQRAVSLTAAKVRLGHLIHNLPYIY